MGNKDKLKEIGIKNRTSFYFDDIMKVIDIDFSDILLIEKSYESAFIYGISYKTFMGAKPLYIWFEKINGFSKIYDGIRYLTLFAPERYAIYDRKYHTITEKSGIKYSINHNFARVRRIDLYNSLSIEKTLTFHNVIILIKSVVNKNENSYCYNVFLEKGSSVKWSVLAHLKSQPRGQNLQAQKPVERSSPHHTRTKKKYQKHI